MIMGFKAMDTSISWKKMVGLLFAASLVLTAAPASARPPLLDAAFNSFLEHQGRWAYTETHSGVSADGTPTAETIIRVDPSQPYSQQRVPIKLSGKTPSEKQLKEWAERSEQESKRRQSEGPSAPLGSLGAEEFHLQIFGNLVVPELDRATVLAEDDIAVTYDVPMHKVGDTVSKPFDVFQLTARVNKEQRQFERVTIRQRVMVRVGGGKNSDGLTEIEFASPDPRYPAVPVKSTSRSTNKPLFGKANTRGNNAVRTDLKHVTPYDERFGVKIGPMRTIQF